MKQQIDNLISNILLDEGEVCLPQVGTLILRRHGAKLLSSKQLQRPYRELCFTGEERGCPLVEHIEQVAKVSAERASDIYAEWLAQSLCDGVLAIEGVGTIENRVLHTEQQFDIMANPKGGGTIKINPRTNYFIYIIAGLCMGFALGVAGYVLYTNGAFDKFVAEQPIVATSEKTEVAPEQSTSPVEQASSVEPVAEVATEVIEADKAPEPTAELSILPMRKGSSYAVWGVYNELKNAEDAKHWLASHYSEIEANIYQYDARYMVALCELPSRSQCGRQVSAWRAQYKSFKSVWVYTR